jgi:sugar lactone lactonase YvrE
MTVRRIKVHEVLLSCLLGLGILWGPTATADPVDAVADKVFGQPNFTSNIANNGGVSASSLNGPNMVDLDFGGNLYISDSNNNRVLIYFFPNGTDKVADIVLGQPNFISTTSNNGGISASSLSAPTDMILDLDGNLYVVDALNNRVLVYFDPLNSDTIADIVFGQPNFISNTANNGGVSDSSLWLPQGLTLDTAGNLYVADGNNNRVLVYLDPLNSDNVADVVLGQPDFNSNTANNGGLNASSLSGPRAINVDSAGNVYIVDRNNNRMLEYNTPLTTDKVADVVFGQPNFTSNTANNGGISASSLFRPTSVNIDNAGNVWVTDSRNNRVLEYHTPLASDTVADVVLGQPNFTSNTANNGGISASSLNQPQRIIVDIFGNIYVTDTANHRVLVYDGILIQAQAHTCTGFDDPFANPLALKKKSKRTIPLKMTLTNSEGAVITDTDVEAPPVVNVLFGGQVFGEVPPDSDDLLPTGGANEDNIFRFNDSTDQWEYNLDTKQFTAPGVYTVKPVAGNDSYTIDTGSGCIQTFERLN